MAVDIKLLAKLDGVLAKYEYSCRLCLMPTANAKDGVSLFATYANNIPMSQLVEDSVNIQVRHFIGTFDFECQGINIQITFVPVGTRRYAAQTYLL